MGDEPVPHFVGTEGDYLSTRCCTFPPVVTAILAVLILVLHYAISLEDRSSWRYGDPDLPGVEWHGSISAVFAHGDDSHAIYNAIVRRQTTL